MVALDDIIYMGQLSGGKIPFIVRGYRSWWEYEG